MESEGLQEGGVLDRIKWNNYIRNHSATRS